LVFVLEMKRVSVTQQLALQKKKRLRHCLPSNNQVHFLLKYGKYLH